MRLTAAAIIAGAASSAAAAAVTYSSSGKPQMTSSNLDTTATRPYSFEAPRVLPYVTVTQLYTVTTTSTTHSKYTESRSASPTKRPIITETELAQPSDQPTPGGYKTIGCGCSYKFPNGYIECPFSGSEPPPAFCSSEVITTTNRHGHGQEHDNATKPTASQDLDTTTGEKTNPTSALASIISAASSWPIGVHPGMTPPHTPRPNGTCVGTLDGTFNLGQANVSPASDAVMRVATHTNIAEISLINGTLIDSLDRIGSIVANGQFQFDGPPQAGTLYTAGWSACGVERDRKLTFGGNTIFYSCSTGDFSNLYYKPIRNVCSSVELFIVEEEEGDIVDDHDNESDQTITPWGDQRNSHEVPEEDSLDAAALLNDDVPEGCNSNSSLSSFDIDVVGMGESDHNNASSTDSSDDHGLARTPALLLSRFVIWPAGVLQDLDGRAAGFDEHDKLRFEYGVSNELPWSACENKLLAFGESKGFYECGAGANRTIYDSDVGRDCVQVKLVLRSVSPTAPVRGQRNASLAPVVSIPAKFVAGEDVSLSKANSVLPVPAVSASATPSLVNRAGIVNDQPANLNYLLTTKTFTLPAVTGTDLADDNVPATTWTLPATTLIITESPAPTKTIAAREDIDLPGALESLSYWNSVLTSAQAELATLQTQQASPVISSAAALSTAVALRDDGCDAICTLDGLLSTILSASSASEYWGIVASSYSLLLHESTVTFVNTACQTFEGVASCKTDTLFFATQTPPPPPQAREASITSPPVPRQTLPSRDDGDDCDAICTLDAMLSSLLSARSLYEYYGWLATSISMDMHESTVTFTNEECATVAAVSSCSTETLFFDTQAPPQIRAEATPTGPIAVPTATILPANDKHGTIFVITKTVTTLETIVKPSTTFTSTYTTLDTCTEYIGGKCMQKRIVEARQEGNPCPDQGCTAYTTFTRDFPLTTVTYTGFSTERRTTISAYTTTETWYTEPGSPRRLHRKEGDTTLVTASVPVATVTALVTGPSSSSAPSSDTTCTNSTIPAGCPSGLCSFVTPNATASFHWSPQPTTSSSAVVSPVTASNSTTTAYSTDTVSTTSFVNGTYSQTSAPPQSTTADLGGGSTSEAHGGKQMVMATVGMAFFAALAFCL